MPIRTSQAAAAVVAALLVGWATVAVLRAGVGGADPAVLWSGQRDQRTAAPAPSPSGEGGGASGQAERLAPAGSPVARHGQLRVCGVKLCDRAGKPIQLRGMSSHGIQWFPNCLNRDSLRRAARRLAGRRHPGRDVRAGGRVRDRPGRLHRPGERGRGAGRRRSAST